MLRAARGGLIELVDGAGPGVLASLPRPEDDLALRSDRDVLDVVLLRLRAQDERRVADPREERAHDGRQHVEEDERARPAELAGHDGRPERARRVEARAGERA